MASVDDVQYVPLAEAHLSTLMEIEVEAYPEPWSLGMFRDEIRNRLSWFYVVLRQGAIIGYGGFWLVLDEAHLTSVTVRQCDRGRGYGKRLLHFLLAKAKELGVRVVTLEVRRSNERAQRLYLENGFRSVGIRKGYYSQSNEDAIVMMVEFPRKQESPGESEGEPTVPTEEANA